MDAVISIYRVSLGVLCILMCTVSETLLGQDITEYTVVHNFSQSLGAQPEAELLFANGFLWGTTYKGGTFDQGTVFRLNIDGTGHTVVHHFDGISGSNPWSGLTASANYLWGTTQGGGTLGKGTVFRLNPDGSGYTVVHQFIGSNGSLPRAGLTRAGDYLWGTTYQGGPSNLGTVFRMNLDGTGLTAVLSFDRTNGAIPDSGLVATGSYLFGAVEEGGTSNKGTIYRLNLDGTRPTIVHHFDGTFGDSPGSALVEAYGYLWGTTTFGGYANNQGTIFRMNLDGSGHTIVLHHNGSNGRYPVSGLLAASGYLWGVTSSGGTYNYGTIFRLNRDGSGQTIVHRFNSERYPTAALIEAQGDLWGTTSLGGASGAGTIFKVKLRHEATFTIQNIVQRHDGNPRTVTVLPTPPEATFVVTYDGSIIPPTIPGVYTVNVRGTGAFFGEASGQMVIHTEAQVSHSDWAEANYGPVGIDDPLISAPLADPTRSGYTNLVRYAFGMSSRDLPNHDFSPKYVEHAGEQFLEVVVPRKGYASDIRYVVEGSSDLHTWSAVTILLPGFPTLVSVRDNLPVKVGSPRFLRVRVELLP